MMEQNTITGGALWKGFAGPALTRAATKNYICHSFKGPIDGVRYTNRAATPTEQVHQGENSVVTAPLKVIKDIYERRRWNGY